MHLLMHMVLADSLLSSGPGPDIPADAAAVPPLPAPACGLEPQPSLPASGKVAVQCLPLDDATGQLVLNTGGNPMLEVTCKCGSAPLPVLAVSMLHESATAKLSSNLSGSCSCTPGWLALQRDAQGAAFLPNGDRTAHLSYRAALPREAVCCQQAFMATHRASTAVHKVLRMLSKRWAAAQPGPDMALHFFPPHHNIALRGLSWGGATLPAEMTVRTASGRLCIIVIGSLLHCS